MYTEYYGLHAQPFQMTPDARMFFPSSVHQRAYAHLTYGLAQREGFVVVTGEVGAGKTTLIERLCSELDPAGFVVARIATTLVSGDDVLRMVAHAFGADPEGNKSSVLRGITYALRSTMRRHLLIVDEAQGLPLPALEELRMLSNVTQPGQPPLQTILVGQPQLRRMLVSPDLDQLRQRVLASYHLVGLTRDETHEYVKHRLSAAGWTDRPAWDDAALTTVYQHTDGIPRRINRLCARVMLSGALEEAERLTSDMVEMTALELDVDLGGPCHAPHSVRMSMDLPRSPSPPAPQPAASQPTTVHAAPSQAARPQTTPSHTSAPHTTGPDVFERLIHLAPAPQRSLPQPSPQPPPQRGWIVSFLGAKRGQT